MKKIMSIICFAAFIFTFGIACFVKEPVQVLVSERRKAAQLPEFSVEGVMDKSFFSGFEDFLADQFPLRDTFRSIKAAIQLKLLNQSDNNGIYTAEGHISELDYTLNETSVENAANKLNSIYGKYIEGKGAKCYFSVVPDKNYYLAEKNGYPALDYGRMIEIYTSGVENMEYIDIFDCLTLDNYYKTDSHWKQQEIGAVVEKLGAEIGFEVKPSDYYAAKKLADFEGVYAPRLAMGSGFKDEIITMNSPATDGAKVWNLETNKVTQGVYDEAKLEGGDKYDIYLQGAAALLTVENPAAAEKRELVIFRDSFGSSLAPLILEGYSKITLIDLRYISSQMLGEFVDFSGCDVLFIYNTQILNQSSLLK
ncbi:MAG: hypothetical protein IKU08_10015 [Clostridia bacterium]|nr:hypothetical protein [Clostridia bacterium]